MSKRSVAPFVGIQSHYAEYRYGNKRPVYVPGKDKPRPLVNADKHKHLVNKTAEMLGTWKSTKFEHEGACRHGLRSGWCAEGYDWERADAAAQKVVADALNKIGARRPTWEEGQWVYTQSPEQCAWCQGPIEIDEQSRGRRFCSADCAKSAVQHMNRKTNHHYGAVLRSALRLIDKEKSEAKPCKHCGTLFKSDRKEALFCSNRCHGFNQAGDLAFSHQDRECVICSASYKPIHRLQKCCNSKCARKLSLQLEAEKMAGVSRCCTHCDTAFQPLIKSQIYCGKDCQKAAGHAKHGPVWNEKLKAERAANRPPRPCQWCGEVFTPKMTLARYCSSRCTSDGGRYEKGWVPRDVNWRVFDHFVTMPINTVPRWLSAEAFDEMLAA